MAAKKKAYVVAVAGEQEVLGDASFFIAENKKDLATILKGILEDHTAELEQADQESAEAMSKLIDEEDHFALSNRFSEFLQVNLVVREITVGPFA